ncbi:MAG: cysteine--tRNA ligase [Endomicrobiaceae bacterium]|nr:cysteine--tRNA ligase [Endomicrobiaceae bacterium]MDD3921927.1 cysteine--tRNA ligase [Endomicrobiaceae bacterium]
MTIKFHNTLTNKVEEFVPIEKNKISMYICGVTPYDVVHLGHARAYVTFDVIKRHFIRSGYIVNHVQNFTDVDDKIINRSIEKQISPLELAKTYIDDYFVQMDKLNVLKANIYPQVTAMIPQIISFIEKLVGKGFAYDVDGDVYFSVDKFAQYGKLSKRKLEDMRIGARVDADSKKKNPYDFILWKKTKENEPKSVSWTSKWANGRPGWHIECSVMATTLLGDTIDIHGGGQDLIFPHHENEIAQSEACTGKDFSKYWIHNGFVTVNKEKMSKSLGNFFTLKDIFNTYDPRVVRYYLLTQHYRTPLDFSNDNLTAAQKTLQGLDEAYSRLVSITSESDSKLTNEDLIKIQQLVKESLDDDFNFEKALSYLHELKNIILNNLFANKIDYLRQAKWLFEDILEGDLGIKLLKNELDNELLELLEKRNSARKNKDWKQADLFRDEITKRGYKINDNPDGTSSLTKKI